MSKSKCLENLKVNLRTPSKESREELRIISAVVRLEAMSMYYKELVNEFGNNKQSLEGG